MSNDLQTKTKNLETGQKNATEALGQLNSANNQQKLIEDLAKNPDNDVAQGALIFQMAGVERPEGMKRLPPSAVEELHHVGGISEKLQRMLMNWKQGDVLPRESIPELVEAAKTLTASKVKTANDALQTNFETYGYKHPGTGPHGRMDENQPQTGGGQSPPPQEGPTATGPNGHKIKVVGGKWVDAATGKPI